MKIEDIKKELNDLGLCRFDNTEEQNKSIQRQTLYLTMILELDADKLEMANAVKDVACISGRFTDRCNDCQREATNFQDIKHSENCIVNKANKYIKEVEK